MQHNGCSTPRAPVDQAGLVSKSFAAPSGTAESGPSFRARHRTEASRAILPGSHSPKTAPMLDGQRPPGLSRCAHALLHLLAAATLVTAVAGCDQAHSSETGNDKMILGLFKGKTASTVDAAVGAPLVRHAALPAAFTPPPAPAYPPVRDLGGDALPPAGKLAPNPSDGQPIRAYVAPASGAHPGVAIVNLYEPRRETQLWQMAPHDDTRFGARRAAQFSPDQAKWVAFDAETVMTLPAGQVLIHLTYDKPVPTDGLFVYDIAADRLRLLAEGVTPDWSQGLPFKFIDALQVAPDAVLVLFHSYKQRLGPQRYVNRVDHLVLFSAAHPAGVPVLTLGIDDGNVRQWGLVGRTLWLNTSDDRGAKPRDAIWSLDLAKLL